jgi:hypothetical protein
VVWVPDTDAPGFDEEVRRQSEIAAESAMAEEDQAFVDSLADELFHDLDAEGL